MMEKTDIGLPQHVSCENNSTKNASVSSKAPCSFYGNNENKSDQSLCDPCLVLEKQEVATSLCLECEERLCAYCTNQHRTRKLTKSHEVKSLESIPVMVECGLCENKTDQGSCMYCNDCEETLCSRCAQKHSNKNVFKHHKLVMSDSKARKEISVCDPCKQNEEVKTAETFCAQCEEHLCDICTRYHRALKATKEHKLKSLSSEISPRFPCCEPCSGDGMSVNATRVCAQCEEHLCDKCAEEHTSMKMMKGHQINDISEVFKQDNVWCGQCKEEGVFEKAVKLCSDCKDYLCVNCCKIHKRFKLSKDHSLLDIDEVKQSDVDIRSTMMTCGDNNDTDTMRSKEDRPGKPRRLNDILEVVSLTWDPPSDIKDGYYYQISYKELEHDGKWALYDEVFQDATAELNDLRANTVFVFRVRVLYEDREGPFSEESNEIKTSLSSACQVSQQSVSLVKGNFSSPVYGLPMNEIMRHETLKISKLEFGSTETTQQTSKKTKTILILGGTGSGKSTMIDLIVNYILGVNWNDPFRFKVTDLNNKSKDRGCFSAASLTEWITCYTINNINGSRLCYQLNIIDTPGFGNTRGYKRDQEIVDQLREILSDKQPYGLALIDVVCFVIKAHECRLTSFQTYIFQSVLTLFGKDIGHHICSFMTFSDCTEPSVIDTLKEYKFPFGPMFSFNNASLCCKTAATSNCRMKKMFWQMGIKSLHSFFSHIETIEAKSLHMTKMVLRHQLSLRETSKFVLCHINVLMECKSNSEEVQKELDKDRSVVDNSQTIDNGNMVQSNINAETLERISANERNIEHLGHKIKTQSEEIERCISILKSAQDRLKEKALLCRSFSEYLDLLIQNEELEKSERGFEGIKILKEMSRKAGFT
ncbi:uncharacterized protein LOC132742949 [Ruditapes philippinarum]|uniref:uncharacterized protein LOC132742949 n=1 Tax=Ruditapes philippinarum TaxID=129788 RepID=UPI00295BC8D1|nr:uncharacterized protein LOC132742949 [Ruditapes philippinarum]